MDFNGLLSLMAFFLMLSSTSKKASVVLALVPPPDPAPQAAKNPPPGPAASLLTPPPPPPAAICQPHAPPPQSLTPPRNTKECFPLCWVRCACHSRKNVCLRACVTCCDRCKCVPPGYYGQKEKCGDCYLNMTTRGGKSKCP